MIAAACTNPSDPTFDPGARAPQARPGERPLWDGRWTGQKAEGQPVTFTIVGNEITKFSIGIHLTGDCHIGIFKAAVGYAAADGSACNTKRASTWTASRNW